MPGTPSASDAGVVTAARVRLSRRRLLGGAASLALAAPLGRFGVRRSNANTPAAAQPAGSDWEIVAGAAPAADEFLGPAAFASEHSGTFLVGDAVNNRVVRFSPDGVPLGAFGVRGHQPGQFVGLTGLAVGPDGDIFVAESNRVQRLRPDGRAVWWRGGYGQRVGEFQGTGSVAVDATGHVYASDPGNARIQVLAASTGEPLAAWDMARADAAHGPRVRDLKFGPDGTLWVLDGVAYALRGLAAPSGQQRATIPLPRDVWGSDELPVRFAPRTSGTFYLAFNAGRQVREVSAAGVELQRTGTGPGGDALGNITGLLVDPRGRLLVGDPGNARVVVLDGRDLRAPPLATWGRRPTDPARDATGGGIAVAPDGTFFLSRSMLVDGDLIQGLQRYAADGTPLEFLGGPRGDEPGQFFSPRGLALGPDGSLYVADLANHRVQRIAADGSPLASYAGPWDTSDGREEELALASDVALGPDGDLYILDGRTSRVVRIDPDACTLRGVWRLEPSDDVLASLAVGLNGLIYVTERSRNRISVLGPDGGLLTRWGSFGDGPGQLMSPADVVVDDAGQVYVADEDNQRIQVLSTDGTPLAQWGQPGRAPGEFQNPSALAFDAAGILYVVDSGNHRVQRRVRQGAGATSVNWPLRS